MPTIVPIFRIFDYAKAIEFYVDWLEFQIVFEHRPEDLPFYMRVSIRGIMLDLSEHHGDCSPGAKIIIENFEGLKEYHARLTAKGYKYMRPGLQAPEWDANTLSMTVIDPFSNKIVFTEPNNDILSAATIQKENENKDTTELDTIIEDINAGKPLEVASNVNNQSI